MPPNDEKRVSADARAYYECPITGDTFLYGDIWHCPDCERMHGGRRRVEDPPTCEFTGASECSHASCSNVPMPGTSQRRADAPKPTQEASIRCVDQTVFTVPGGNCFSACVATILGIELADVPYFMGDFEEADKAAWFERFAAWLKPQGYWPINFRLSDEWSPPPDAIYILSAGSPRGDWDHSVVAQGPRAILHDPHPSRAGLVRLEKSEATLLIPYRTDLRRESDRDPVVWADEASPFTGAQVKALLDENERLRRESDQTSWLPQDEEIAILCEENEKLRKVVVAARAYLATGCEASPAAFDALAASVKALDPEED